MMILYIALSYLVMLGIMINTHESSQSYRAESIFVFMLSPITLPIIIGMMISDK